MIILVVALMLAVSLAGTASAAETGAKRLQHVVSLKFKPTATRAQIDAVVTTFRELKKKIPAIHQLEWGTNVSPEKHDKGFTHVFILSFTSEKDRDLYLVHPDHKAFGKVLGPVMEDVFVLDFWAQN
jgi:hypothetical protein